MLSVSSIVVWLLIGGVVEFDCVVDVWNSCVFVLFFVVGFFSFVLDGLVGVAILGFLFLYRFSRIFTRNFFCIFFLSLLFVCNKVLCF